MLGSVRLSDYRCFRREAPATLELTGGFTAFVGANNAGKSTLIRSLFELRPTLSHFVANFHVPTHLLSTSQGFQVRPPMYEAAEIVNDRDDPSTVVEFLVPSGIEAVLEIQRVVWRFSQDGNQFKVEAFASDGRQVGGAPGYPLVVTSGDDQRWITNDGIAIDVGAMRALLTAIVRTQYIGPFRNALNEGAGLHFDTEIGTSFITKWSEWQTGSSLLQNRAIKDVTKEIRRLIGADSLHISASHDQKTLQVSVDDRPHKLQSLGSGLAQLVVVLGNALIRRPSFVVIDEPEIHLHPGLQIEFLTTLAKYAEFGVLFATHSIGLARAIGDRCSSVQKDARGSIVRPLSQTPHYAEFLGSLGIAGLQEIGWDRILLVEGPKDVRTFQQLLRLYEKDRKTVVLPLGGSSLINGRVTEELTEVVRLCRNVSAIVDSERESANQSLGKPHAEFQGICASLSISCCVTERRAIENYISQGALDKAFPGRFKAIAEFDAPAKDGSFWGKGETWKAASHITRAELAATDIGKFLEGL